MERSIVVIGGGAAGLTAAIRAAENNASVTVLEQNEKPGKKLLASGNGKCNLTHSPLDISQYHCDHAALLSSVFSRFSETDTLEWFSKLGLFTFSRDGWIYPRTEQASSVLDVLLFEAAHLHIKMKTKEEVQSLQPSSDGIWKVKTKTWEYAADAVVLACGSPASSVRGSSDTAIRLADTLGILRHAFLPALVPLQIDTPPKKDWSGTRVHAAVSLWIDSDRIATETGELQLTAYGVSGIPILQLSRFAVPALGKKQEVRLCIDFLPELSEDDLKEEWRNRQTLGAYKSYAQLMTGLVPDRLIPVLLSYTDLLTDSLPTLEDQQEGGKIDQLLTHIKAFPCLVKGAAPLSQAQICSGGISLAPLSEDLEIAGYPGLFVAGEAACVDGPCGGYNLQWAWSSGTVAGKAAARST